MIRHRKEKVSSLVGGVEGTAFCCFGRIRLRSFSTCDCGRQRKGPGLYTASRAIFVILSVYQPASSRAACYLKVITEAQHDNVFVLARQIENLKFAVGIGDADTHLPKLAFVEIIP